MSRQNLLEDKAMTVLDGLIGKNTSAQILAKMEEECPEAVEIDLYQKKLDEIRRLIGRHRKRCQPEDELLSLYEVREDGTRVDFYRAIRETTQDEDIQAITTDYTIEQRYLTKFHRHLKLMKKKHGKQFTRLLNFEVPPLPAPTEALPI